jgi:hypothetical protein
MIKILTISFTKTIFVFRYFLNIKKIKKYFNKFSNKK